MKLTRIEQESCILWNEAEPTAEVEAYNAKMKRQLEKLLEEQPDNVKLLYHEEYADTYQIPKNWIKIRPPRKISEATKERLREQLSKTRPIRFK